LANSTWPQTASSKLVLPDSGTANRTAAGAPLARRRVASGPPLLQFFLGAEAVIGVAGRHQFGRRLGVDLHALALVVRAFIPIEAQPSHAFEDAFHHFAGRALEVGVFDPEDQSSTVMPGKEPVE
jgi:hypothetical protein